MKRYLKGIVSQLSNYSRSLNMTALFVDKPWVMINDEFKIQKLIFKRNKDLIISKNGKARVGKWDYYPAVKSLLIDTGKKKLLCNEAFIDEGVLILKLDGTQNRYFVLANQSIVPDLNVIKYLNKLKYEKLRIMVAKLEGGRELEINLIDDLGNSYVAIAKGLNVYEDGLEAADGSYTLEDHKKYLLVEGGKIKSMITPIFYTTTSGLRIEVHQQYSEMISSGDKVYVNGFKAPDGKYKLGFLNAIRVKNGTVAI